MQRRAGTSYELLILANDEGRNPPRGSLAVTFSCENALKGTPRGEPEDRTLQPQRCLTN